MMNSSQNWDGRERRSMPGSPVRHATIATPALTGSAKLTSWPGGAVARMSTTANPRAVEPNSTLPAEPVRVRAPMPSDLAVGRKIRQLRRSSGITQANLASAVGVTGAQLHRYETGSTRVAASRMIAIAEALGVAPDVLLNSGAPELSVPAPALPTTGDDVLELIQLFGAIGDAKKREAVLAIARMMAPTCAADGSSG